MENQFQQKSPPGDTRPTRRDFVKTTALAVGISALAELTVPKNARAQSSTPTVKENKSTTQSVHDNRNIDPRFTFGFLTAIIFGAVYRSIRAQGARRNRYSIVNAATRVVEEKLKNGSQKQ